MIVHNLIQGSPEWLAYRAQHFNASDAPAMMGCSPYKTRAQLLREMHTGVPPEVDIGTQKRFDNGHRAEALARPLAEQIIGAELYPVTGSAGRLSASFDGLTLDEMTGFEHKALNADLRAAFDAMWKDRADGDQPGRYLPIYHRVQMEQQLHVSGAERILFMASEWTADGDLVEERHCWYYPDDELRGAILAGWAQFDRDLAAYALPEPAAEPARAEPMESLPAVSVRLDGALSVVGNLPTFAVALKAFIERIPKQPATDSDFATTEAACKSLKRAEEALGAAEAGALASITDVEAMRRAVADCRKLARDTRLAAEKLVERRKVEIKEQAIVAARRALADHVAALDAELAPMRLQPVAADFPGAIKGLRSIASMQDALDTTLAAGKIAADAQARQVRTNKAHFAAEADGLQFLFADLGTVIHKAPEDFAALVSSRIAAHRATEAEKERKRKADEEARIQAEAQRLAAEQIRQAELTAQRAESARLEALAAENRARLAAQQSTTQPGSAGGQVDGRRASESHPAGCSGPGPQDHTSLPASPPQAPRADEPATLKLGTICDRLGFVMSAAFLADALHVKPARTEGASKLYTESQYALICRQLISHVAAMAELYAGEPA